MNKKNDVEVKVSKTALQQKAERNKMLREHARRNRAAKGIQTDPGVTFADIPYEQRLDFLERHEASHKARIKPRKGRSHLPGDITDSLPSFHTEEPITIKTK